MRERVGRGAEQRVGSIKAGFVTLFCRALSPTFSSTDFSSRLYAVLSA